MDARHDPLADELPLELGDRRQDVEEQAPGRRRGVDRLIEDDQLDPQGLELPREPDQVMRAPGEAIQLGAGHDIDPAGADRGQGPARCSLAPDTP
jgi:hypothetical protein